MVQRSMKQWGTQPAQPPRRRRHAWAVQPHAGCRGACWGGAHCGRTSSASAANAQNSCVRLTTPRRRPSRPTTDRRSSPFCGSSTVGQAGIACTLDCSSSQCPLARSSYRPAQRSLTSSINAAAVAMQAVSATDTGGRITSCSRRRPAAAVGLLRAARRHGSRAAMVQLQRPHRLTPPRPHLHCLAGPHEVAARQQAHQHAACTQHRDAVHAAQVRRRLVERGVGLDKCGASLRGTASRGL